MISFNIIGVGVLELANGIILQFTRENVFYRFNDISLGRTVEFDAPATDHNREILGFAEDFTMYGEACRRFLPCEMQYDGGADTGRLEVTGYANGAFKCIYYVSYSALLEQVMNKPLRECILMSEFKPVGYGDTPVRAYDAIPAKGVQNIMYDNGLTPAGQQLSPSVNLKTFCEEIIIGQGYSPFVGIDEDYWLVAGSINGGAEDTITIGHTNTTTAVLSPSVNNYIEKVNENLKWANGYIAILGGVYTGLTTTPAEIFRAKDDIHLRFGSVPRGVYLVLWADNLNNYRTIGGVAADGTGDPHTADGNPTKELSYATVNVPKGSKFFFAMNKFARLNGNDHEYGYLATAQPVSYSVDVSHDGELSPGDRWNLRNNMPEMTFLEFLRYAALATGNDIVIDGDEITILKHENDATTTLDNVTAVESVARCVGCWGEDSKVALVKFDSEDYVTQPIVTNYAIDIDRIKGEHVVTVPFSEGNIGSGNDVQIRDVEKDDNNVIHFVGKKWTIAMAAAGQVYLQRIEQPDLEYCGVIADAATCVSVSVVEDLDAFLSRRFTSWVNWRGGQFVWTDAVWSGGVTKLTLQKV